MEIFRRKTHQQHHSIEKGGEKLEWGRQGGEKTIRKFSTISKAMDQRTASFITDRSGGRGKRFTTQVRKYHKFFLPQTWRVKGNYSIRWKFRKCSKFGFCVWTSNKKNPTSNPNISKLFFFFWKWERTRNESLNDWKIESRPESLVHFAIAQQFDMAESLAIIFDWVVNNPFTVAFYMSSSRLDAKSCPAMSRARGHTFADVVMNVKEKNLYLYVCKCMFCL